MLLGPSCSARKCALLEGKKLYNFRVQIYTNFLNYTKFLPKSYKMTLK